MIRGAVMQFPNFKVVATTLREVHSTNRHSWSAVAWINGKTYSDFTVVIRDAKRTIVVVTGDGVISFDY
jgi:2-dehydro-3-deoxygluconokinase